MTVNYKGNGLNIKAITDSWLLGHGLVPQNKFYGLHLTAPRSQAPGGGAHGRKPFGVPEDNLTEAGAIASEDGIIGAHIKGQEKKMYPGRAWGNLRSQAGAWEREKKEKYKNYDNEYFLQETCFRA
jgi:hypothetical protein